MAITDEKIKIPVEGKEDRKTKTLKDVKDETTLALSGIADGRINEPITEEEKEETGANSGTETEPKDLEVLPSQETAKIVANIDLTVLSREKAYADLGEIAKKDIYYGDDKKQAEIDAKTAQELEMTKGLDDAAYANLTGAQKIKHYLSFSLASGKNIQRVTGRGLVDTERLNTDEKKHRRETLAGEREQVADSLKKTGIKQEEIDGMEMSIRYEEQGGRVVKILERTKTEDEIARAAEKLIAADLAGLEKGLGADLIKNKESLEKHQESGKGVKELTKDLGLAATKGIEEKMKKEGEEKAAAIAGQEKELAAELNKFRTPLEGRLKEISGIVDEFSSAFEDLKINENVFAERVRNFDMKIRQAEKSGLLEDTKKELLVALNTQKAQDAVDLAALKDRREAIQKRLAALKKDKEQTEKMLERINRIGKTREDIRREQEAARAKEANKETTGAGAEVPATEEGDGTGDESAGEVGVPPLSASELLESSPAGGPKTGAAGGKENAAAAGKEGPAAAGAETGAEKELAVTARKIVETVMARYSLDRDKHKNSIQKYLTKKGEEFNPDKILEEKDVRAGLDKYCLNVRKINEVKAREVEIDEIIKSLKEVS